MATSSAQISELILEQLSGGERRVLSLTVSVGKVMNRNGGGKGDLSQMVRSALRALVANRTIVETDGIYSLSRAPSEATT